MTHMSRLAENDPPRPPNGDEPEPCLGSTAAAQLMAMLHEVCRIQKQHRVRLMLVERSLRTLRRRVLDDSQATSHRQPYGNEDLFASHRFRE